MVKEMIYFPVRGIGKVFFITGILLVLLIGSFGSAGNYETSGSLDARDDAATAPLPLENDMSPHYPLNLDESKILTIRDREIKTRIRSDQQGIAVELDGENKPFDFDFPQVVAQIHHRTGGNLKIASIEIVDAPNQRIENQVIIGGNISLTNCPNSIVRNNTIKDVVQPASGIARGFGIRLDNCSNSLVTNNTISNISSAETSEVNNWAYGIWIADSNDTTISGNILANISANRYSRGIYWSSEKNIKNLTIINNVFTNITVSASTALTPAAYGIELALSQNFNDTRIANNSFTGLSAKGVHANTYGLAVPGGNLDGMTVTNNSFTNSSSTATGGTGSAESHDLYFDVGTTTNLTITSNTITATSANGTEGASGEVFSAGINLQTGPADNLQIRQNSFINGSFVSNADTQVYGMFLEINDESNNLVIAENTFTNSSGTSISGQAQTYGLNLYQGASNNTLITANSFSDSSARGATSTWAHGIYLEIASADANNLTITDNTLGDTSATSTDVGSYAYGVYLYVFENLTNCRIASNIFTNGSAISELGEVEAYGIYIKSDADAINLTITDNYFGNLSATTSGPKPGTSKGIFHFTGVNLTNSRIFNNVFLDSSVTAESTVECRGIEVQTYTGNASTVIIADNTFGNTSATSISDWTSFYGISLAIDTDLIDCRITNNTFTDGPQTAPGDVNSYGILLGTLTGNALNVTIMDNTFGDISATSSNDHAFTWGVYLSISENLTNCQIADNVFTDSSGTGKWGAETHGIKVATGDSIDNVTISDNTFGDTSATSGSAGATQYGCYIVPSGTATSFTISGNSFLDNAASSTSLPATSYGISMVRCENAILRANTFANTSAFSSGTVQAFGLAANSCNNTEIVENIITSMTPSAFDAIYLIDSYGANLALYETSLYNVTWADPSLATNTFTVYRNGSTVDSGTLSTTITLDTTGLIPRVYNFTIFITDGGSLSVTDTLFVTVLDAIPPTVSSPDDLTIEDDTTGNILSWDIADANGINAGFSAFFYVNGSLDDSQTGLANTTSSVAYSLDNLAVGVYNVTVVVYDSSGNYAANTVILTVQDTTSPVIVSSSGNSTIEQGSTGNSITWNATDANVGTYCILQNGTEVANGSWVSGAVISHLAEGLAVGEYNFTIVVADAFSNSVADTLILTVQDTTPPAINSFDAHVTIVEDSPVLNLAWNATDLNPGTYQIFQNGTEVASGSWTSGFAILYSAEGLAAGSYNFTLIVTDAFGNSVIETALVSVTESSPSTATSGDEDDGLNPFVIIGVGVVAVAVISAGAGAAIIYIRRIRGL
jgi:hypothetical protein